MAIIEYRNKTKLEEFLRRNTSWHLYALADLDEPFWESTRWFVAIEDDKIAGAAILIQTLETPILYGICSAADPAVRAIVQAIDEKLPKRFFAHVGLNVLDVLNQRKFHSEGEANKMVLPSDVAASLTPNHSTDRENNFETLKEFYANRAYGDNTESRFFEPYMLKMSPYRVVKQNGKIVSAAGVHVASATYRVAALGNIATSPEARGNGYASTATAALVSDLRPHFDHIGLNVLTSNKAAVRCYEKLGFVSCLKYEEGLVTREK